MSRFLSARPLMFLAALSGCATLPATGIENFNDRKIEYAQINHTQPIVVFENGLRASMSSWHKVFPELEGHGGVESWPWWAGALQGLSTDSQKQELSAAVETGQQVLRLPTFSGIPVNVLSAEEKSDSEGARYINEKKADLPSLYLHSCQIGVDSGHFIPYDKPEVVIQAIRDIAIQASRPCSGFNDPGGWPKISSQPDARPASIKRKTHQ